MQHGGDIYFDEVTRMLTSGMYTTPTMRVVTRAEFGLPQPAPKALSCMKLANLIKGIHFYHLGLTEDSRKISLDAIYNIRSYVDQLLFKLDKMKDFNLEYVQECIRILEHKGKLHRLNPPDGRALAGSSNRPVTVDTS